MNTDTRAQSDLDVLTVLNRDYIASVQNGDVRRFSEILAEDFLCSNPDGSLVDKPQFLAQTAVTISGLVADDLRVRIVGDVAIIHGRTSYTTAGRRAAEWPLYRCLGTTRRNLAGGQRACDAVGSSGARMRMVLDAMLGWRQVVALGIGLALAMPLPAHASRIWNWSYSGAGIAASGTFTTTGTANSSGYYQIVGITGSRNGATITGLQPTGTPIPGNEPYAVDNLISLSAPQLTVNGFGFSTAAGDFANPFYANFLPSPGYLEFISAPPFTPIIGPEDSELPVLFTAALATAVPEPDATGLLLVGLAGLVAAGFGRGGLRRLRSAYDARAMRKP